MKMTNPIMISALATTLLIVSSTTTVLAQDPVKMAPDVYKVTIDNEHVRVLDVNLKSGGKTPMHAHPAHVVVALSPCSVKFTLPDGTSKVSEMKAGDVFWSDATSHAAENMGADCHALNIEMKKSKSKAK